MKIKLIRYCSFVVIILVLLSCSSALEKSYNEDTENKDLITIRREIESSDFELLILHLRKLKAENAALKGRMYSGFLTEAKNIEVERLTTAKQVKSKNQKIEKIRVATEKIKEEEQKIIAKKIKNEENLKLLCAGKWGIYYISMSAALEVETPQNSSFKKYQPIETEVSLDASQNWISFSADYTFVMLDYGEIIESKWEYEEGLLYLLMPPEKPSTLSKRKMNKIILLNDKEFHILEEETVVHTQKMNTITKMRKI